MQRSVTFALVYKIAFLTCFLSCSSPAQLFYPSTHFPRISFVRFVFQDQTFVHHNFLNIFFFLFYIFYISFYQLTGWKLSDSPRLVDIRFDGWNNFRDAQTIFSHFFARQRRVISFKNQYRFTIIYKFWPTILNVGLITRTFKNTVCFVQRAWHKYVTNRYEFQDMTATCSSMSDFSRCPRNVEWTNTRPHSLRIVRDPGVAREIYNATPSRFECLASKLVNRIIIFKTVAIRSHDNIIE